jgi:uncharacterized RDD family membrane protein YckC
MRILSGLVRLVGSLFLIAGILLLASLRFAGGMVVMVPCGLACAVAGSALLILAKRMTAKTYDQVATGDPRPPVLFLRAFTTDKIGQRSTNTGWLSKLQYLGSPIPLNLTTQYEQMELAFADIGPVKALARPGSVLKLVGVPTVQAPNDRWHEEVLASMRSAALVVIWVGGTHEGLKWEMEQVFDQTAPTQIIFILPASQEEYNRFAAFLSDVIGKKTPEFKVRKNVKDCSGLLYFTADGTPMIEKAPRPIFAPPSNFFNTTAIYFKMMLVKVKPQLAASYSALTIKDRVKAFLLDLIVVVPVSFLLAGISTAIGWFPMNYFFLTSGIICFALVGFVYPFFAEMISARSTWGKRKVGIYVADKVHVRPSLQQLFQRNFCRLFLLMMLSVGIVVYVVVAWFKDIPLLHDYLSRTRIFRRCG